MDAYGLYMHIFICVEVSERASERMNGWMDEWDLISENVKEEGKE